ncbi:hypothetical protein [Saccharospirillum alexandrii]|uniref:HORMA-1 domain-containing protein n=1 Tax=Saccharospirillum alexandrii TaxID=2448477 RepID=UPI003734F9F1
MSYSYTATETKTFTLTHARHLGAKVAADLKRMQRFYGAPDDAHIALLEGEITELLRQGYLGTVTYGFKRNGDWIEPTLRYQACELVGDGLDDDPGRVRPGANVVGAFFYSYLTYNSAWDHLNQEERTAIKKQLPVQRTGAPEPLVSGGYFADDKTYSSGGRALGRATVRSY